MCQHGIEGGIAVDAGCRKAYVSVNVDIDEEGAVQPRAIRWRGGRSYRIDRGPLQMPRRLPKSRRRRDTLHRADKRQRDLSLQRRREVVRGGQELRPSAGICARKNRPRSCPGRFAVLWVLRDYAAASSSPASKRRTRTVAHMARVAEPSGSNSVSLTPFMRPASVQ